MSMLHNLKFHGAPLSPIDRSQVKNRIHTDMLCFITRRQLVRRSGNAISSCKKPLCNAGTVKSLAVKACIMHVDRRETQTAEWAGHTVWMFQC